MTDPRLIAGWAWKLEDHAVSEGAVMCIACIPREAQVSLLELAEATHHRRQRISDEWILRTVTQRYKERQGKP